MCQKIQWRRRSCRPVRLKLQKLVLLNKPTIVDLKINETLQIPTGRVPFRLFRSACLLSACRSPDSIGENPACPACPDVSGMYRGRVGTCSRPRYIGIYQLVGVPILSGRIPIYREMLDESAPVRLESRYIPDTSGQARTYRGMKVSLYFLNSP